MALSKTECLTFDQKEVRVPISRGTAINKIGGILCHICNQIYGSRKEFDGHYALYHPENTEIIYTCVICKIQVSSYASYHSHCYLNHVVKNKFQCKHCEKSFCKLSILNSHILKVHINKCSSCDEKFTTKNELLKHKITHSMQMSIKDGPPYDCITCGKQLNSVGVCENHFEVHSTIQYPCPICSEVLPNKVDATKHLATHFDFIENIPDDIAQTAPSTDSSINILGGILCCYCEQLFQNRSEIDSHISADHEGRIVLYTCNICLKQYEKYNLFGDHCYEHISKYKFQCDQCDKAFPRLSLLVIHTEAFHMGNCTEKPFICEQCKHGFMTRFRLQHHIRIVHNDEPTLKCLQPGCLAIFENPKDLILHEKKHKSLDTWCRQCGLQFASLAAASKHLDVHRRPRHPCPICPKAYGEKHHLTKHMSTHFTKVLHMCQLCGQSFSRPSRLANHFKTHSDSESRTYRCTYCPKAFLKPHELKQHINVHTGLRPYRCTICSKVMSNNPNWRKHLAKVHRLDKAAIDKMKAHRDVEMANSPPKSSEVTNTSDMCIKNKHSDESNEIPFETIDAPDLSSICDPISGERMLLADTVNAVIERIENLDDVINKTDTGHASKTKVINSGNVVEDEESEIQAIVEHIESISQELGMVDNVAATERGLATGAQNLQYVEMLPVENAAFDSVSDNVPQPESLLYQSTDAQYAYPSESLAELMSSDDHILPHINPLLTIKTNKSSKMYVDSPSLTKNDKFSVQNLTSTIKPKSAESIMYLPNDFQPYSPMSINNQHWEPPIITKVFNSDANDLNRMFIF